MSCTDSTVLVSIDELVCLAYVCLAMGIAGVAFDLLGLGCGWLLNTCSTCLQVYLFASLVVVAWLKTAAPASLVRQIQPPHVMTL